jgi:hypothetical protein
MRLDEPQCLSGCFWIKEKSVAPNGIRNPDRPVRSLDTILTHYPVQIKNAYKHEYTLKLYNDQTNAQGFSLFIYLLLPYMFRAFF